MELSEFNSKEIRPLPKPILCNKELLDINRLTYDIENETGEEIGGIELVYDPTDTSLLLDNIFLKEDFRGKGYGKAVYEQIPNLKSPDGRKYSFLSDEVSELSDQAKGVWVSFVKEGKAILREDGRYQMLNEE